MSMSALFLFSLLPVFYKLQTHLFTGYSIHLLDKPQECGFPSSLSRSQNIGTSSVNSQPNSWQTSPLTFPYVSPNPAVSHHIQKAL
jgi:hypothetical protein